MAIQDQLGRIEPFFPVLSDIAPRKQSRRASSYVLSTAVRSKNSLEHCTVSLSILVATDGQFSVVRRNCRID